MLTIWFIGINSLLVIVYTNVLLNTCYCSLFFVYAYTIVKVLFIVWYCGFILLLDKYYYLLCLPSKYFNIVLTIII